MVWTVYDVATSAMPVAFWAWPFFQVPIWTMVKAAVACKGQARRNVQYAGWGTTSALVSGPLSAGQFAARASRIGPRRPLVASNLRVLRRWRPRASGPVASLLGASWHAKRYNDWQR